jgi:hypothetical protein
MIEIRNLKVAKFASEETTCFQARVYFGGKLIGVASNEGHGGPTCVHATVGYDDKAYHAANAWAAKQAKGETFDGHLVDLIDDLVDEQILRKDVISTLKRSFKKKVIFLNKAGELMNCGPRKGWALDIDQLIRSVALRHPEAVILNSLPFDQAVERYITYVKASETQKENCQ